MFLTGKTEKLRENFAQLYKATYRPIFSPQNPDLLDATDLCCLEIEEETTPTTPGERLKNALRIAMLLFLIVSISTFLLLLFTSDQVQTYTLNLIGWMEDLPVALSMSLMVLLYCIALIFFFPGTPFNLAAGFLYDFWFGSLVASLGCVLGALLAFLCGRTIARSWIKTKISKYPKFKAVDWAIRKKGVYIVCLTRLSPLFPFPLLNYAFGITKINILSYFIGTTLGILPATFAYTYLGTLMRNLADMWTATDQKENPNMLLLSLGAIGTLVSIIVITLITKRAINLATIEYENRENASRKNSFEEIVIVETQQKEINDLS